MPALASSKSIRGIVTTMMAVVLLQMGTPARADPPIWANARMVKATVTDCGALHYLTLKGNAIPTATPPDSPGCKSSERTYGQVNVAMAFLQAGGKGQISESNVDVGTILCDNGYTVLILGRAGAIERAIRQNPPPRGCTFSTSKVQHLSSVGSIAFTDVANGGTMSVKESLALHARERDRAIAECNASPACQAEVRRRSAINAYYECMKPTAVAHTCTRPW